MGVVCCYYLKMTRHQAGGLWVGSEGRQQGGQGEPRMGTGAPAKV